MLQVLYSQTFIKINKLNSEKNLVTHLQPGTIYVRRKKFRAEYYFEPCVRSYYKHEISPVLPARCGITSVFDVYGRCVLTKAVLSV